ncbi:MAG: DUF6597 domain-containing transcriptional factor [Gemmatimonadaceae bacterium]
MPSARLIPPGRATAAGAYVEHAPPAALAPHVDCFWSRTAAADETSDHPRYHRVLPDGCVDIVLTFAAPAWSSPAEGAAAEGTAPDVALAVGVMTRPIVIRDSPDATYLGVRFRPGVAGVLFGVPASEMTDERVVLADVWADCEALLDSLARAPDAVARIRTISTAIARRLLAAPAGPPASVTATAARIVAARGAVSIGRLAAELGVTRQYLARAFAHHVGVSPKTLARIVRARSVLERARRGTDADWSAIALDAGYYDQSHLIAELKELTGLPPSAWAAGRS